MLLMHYFFSYIAHPTRNIDVCFVFSKVGNENVELAFMCVAICVYNIYQTCIGTIFMTPRSIKRDAHPQRAHPNRSVRAFRSSKRNAYHFLLGMLHHQSIRDLSVHAALQASVLSSIHDIRTKIGNSLSPSTATAFRWFTITVSLSQ